ncbi:hypothetical protein K0651_03925 [Ornithinimicrobium sp. Arc0846-15]|nr:hypothetical protein [Ornithinimicrobium laminariae]
MQWFLIILVVLIVAAIAYLLTRRPAGGRDKADNGTDDASTSQETHAPGGSHVAAGDSGTVDEHAGPHGDAEPFDQEAPAVAPPVASETSEPEAEDVDEPVADEEPQSQAHEGSYVDTASGDDVPVSDATGEEPTPVVDQPDVDSEPVVKEGPASPIEEQEAEQEAAARSVTFGEPSPAAEETTYAAPASFETAPSDDAHIDNTTDEPAGEEDALGAWTPVDPEPVVEQGGESSAEHSSAGVESVEAPEASQSPTVVPPAQMEWDDTDDIPADATEAGFVEAPATEAPTANESATVPFSDEPTADEPTAQKPTLHSNGSEAPAESPNFDQPETTPAQGEIVEGPYGSGSALANEDGSEPAGYSVKGNQGSMLFHTAESPNFDSSRGDVWFDSEESAKAAGFVHWDRKRR